MPKRVGGRRCSEWLASHDADGEFLWWLQQMIASRQSEIGRYDPASTARPRLQLRPARAHSRAFGRSPFGARLQLRALPRHAYQYVALQIITMVPTRAVEFVLVVSLLLQQPTR